MHDSKLLKLLATLLLTTEVGQLTRRQQQNKLRRLLASPYFAHEKDKHILSLFDYIVQYLPNTQHPALARQAAAQHLFPSRPFDERLYLELRRTMTDLTDLLDKYIVQQTIEQDVQQSQRVLFNFYTHYLIDTAAAHEQLLQTMRQHNAQRPQNSTFYYNEWVIASLEFEYLSLQPANEEQGILQMQRMAHNLEVFFIISKLSQYCHYLNLRKRIALSSILDIDTHLLRFIEHSPYRSLPVVSIYYHAFMMLHEETQAEPYFTELKQLLIEHKAVLSNEALQNFYTYTENHCTLQILSGNNHYRRPLFELYAEQLTSGVIYVDGFLDIRKFKNIVTLAVWLNEFDFAHTFIGQHQHRIQDRYQQEAYHYCRAYLYFGMKKYDLVIDHLHLAQQQKRYFNIAYRTDSHKLFIKTYYECKESNLLAAKLNTFAAFVRNNLGGVAQSQLANNNFVKIMRKLLSLIETNPLYGNKLAAQRKTRKTIDEIQQLLQRETYIAERQWIIECADQWLLGANQPDNAPQRQL